MFFKRKGKQMGKKLGCEFNPGCPFTEMGRVCAHAVFHSGSCTRDSKTFPKSFADNHGMRRENDSGKMSGHAVLSFDRHHSAWRG